MKFPHRLVAVAFAFFIVSSALAQTSGTVTNHAFAIGKGAGQTGYTSLLCASAQLAVGQSAADPICRTITGDVTLSAAGSTAIGTTKVTSAMLNADVFSTAHTWAGQQTFVAPILGTPASGTLTNATGLPISTGVSGLGTGCATFLGTPSSANLRGCLTDETGAGIAYFVGGALGTPASGTATNLTGLPLSGLAAQAAFTFVGNNTSGSAVPIAVDIAALTTKASPAASDYVMLSDQAASGAWKKATVSSVSSAGSVSTLNGQTGAIVSYFPPQGRLSLTTGVPVTLSCSGCNTVYYMPYVGNLVPIYDGTNMVPTVFSEISVLTTDTTKSPAAIGASKVNDWFVWNDAGTIRVGHGPDWTNDTTRSAGTALVRVNGILLNNASITNGPAASRGTYVGTTRSDGSSVLNWIQGGVAAGGTAGFFGLWNMYNRVDVASFVGDSTDSWTYTTINTWRASNASATFRTTMVRGLDEEAVTAVHSALVTAAAAGIVAVGIGVDSTTAFSGTTSLSGNTTSGIPVFAQYSGMPGIGVRFVSGIEWTTVTGGSFNGDAGISYFQSGLHVRTRM